jgi:hypothetical protein
MTKRNRQKYFTFYTQHRVEAEAEEVFSPSLSAAVAAAAA